MKNQELICRGQIIEFNMVYRNNSNDKVELSDVDLSKYSIKIDTKKKKIILSRR